MKGTFQAAFFALIAASFAAVELLRGGTRAVFALPAYALISLAAGLAVFHARRGGVSRQSFFCLLSTTVFFGYLLGRTAFSPDEFLARTNLYLIVASLMLYLLSAFHITLSGVRMGLVAVLLVLGMANCAVGAIQFFKTQNYIPFDFLMPRPDYGFRASGFYNSPNHLAAFLEVAVLMGFSLAWWSRWPTYGKIICGYAAVMCLGGLLLTGSRGGYLGAGCGLFAFVSASLWIVVRRAPERRSMLLVAMFIVVMAVALGVQKTFASSHFLEGRATSMVQREEGGLRELLGVRRMMGNAALKQFLLSPVVGTGAGTYLYYGRQFRSPAIQNDPIYAHNDYLQLLAEYGVVGMVALLISLNLHLRNGWRWINIVVEEKARSGAAQSNSLALAIGAMCSLLAFMVHSILDFNLHIPANVLLVAFVFGLLANPEGQSRAPHDASSPLLSFALRLGPACLAIWMMIFVFPKFPAEVFGEKARMLLSNTDYLQSAETARKLEHDALRGLKIDPRSSELLSFLGEAQVALATMSDEPDARQRKYEESVESFEKALQISPQDRNLVLCLGWSLDALQKFDESAPYFARALQLDPNAADVRWASAAHLHLQGKWAEAEVQYRSAVSLGSRPAEIGLERLVNERR